MTDDEIMMMRRRRRQRSASMGGASRASDAFTPTDPTSATLWAWFDPSQGVTTAGGSVTAFVERANSVSGTGVNNPPHTVANANFNSQPTIGYTSASVQSVGFGGTLAPRFGGNRTPWHILLLMRTSALGAFTVLSMGNSGAAPERRWRTTAGGEFQMITTNGAGTSTTLSSTGTQLAINTTYLLSLEYPGSTFRGRKNGTPMTSMDGVAHDVNADLGTFNGFNFGKRSNNGGANAFTGEIAECLIYSGVLSTADNNAVHQWLGARYGITPATIT